MACLNANTLFDFQEGLLSPEESARVEEHLDSCEACRRMAAELLKDSSGLAKPGSSLEVAPASPADPPRQGSTLGRYLVIEQLGSGGVGVVYAAYDPQLDRKVAFKLLRSDGAAAKAVDEARARLLREARAIARLSHPHVIAVHEVGTFENQVFIAMEYVDGGTLSAWLKERTRAWREILEVFVRAGSGLAAAHAAGLIHRDFKPDNVLVGRDGRVRVTDFGLARAVSAGADVEGPRASAQGSLPAAQTDPAEPLTRSGALLGTPAFMSPEQVRGEPADARSDQFSFCVALYEALYGERPFSGTTLSELAAEASAGRVRGAPAGSQVPAWVRRVLLRGLSARAEDRFPSMTALLSALEKYPRATWRRRASASAALLVAAAVVAAFVWVRRGQAQLCGGAERQLAGVWNEERKQAIHGAFQAASVPYAESVWPQVEATLSNYAARWASLHREACEATRIRGEQSDQMLGLRMLCLDRRRKELEALIRLLARADAQVVQRSVQAAFSLGDLARCMDTELLAARLRAPEGAGAREKAEQVRSRLAEAKARYEGGKYAEGIGIARSSVEDARALRDRSVEAEGLLSLGELQEKAGDAKSSAEALRQAILAAEASHADEVAAKAWSDLIHVLGTRLSRFEEALLANQHAASLIEGLDHDEALESWRLNCLGNAYWTAGRYREAQEQHAAGLAIRERSLAAPHPMIAASYVSVGIDLAMQGKYEEALRTYQKALAMQEVLLGPEHPDVALTLHDMGAARVQMGDLDQALQSLRRALEIRQRALGPDHPFVATSLESLGTVFSLKKMAREAEESLRQAVAVREKASGPESPDVGRALGNLGEHLLSERKYDEAQAVYARSLAIREKALGPDHPSLAYALTGLGLARIERGKPLEALADLERALRLRAKPDIDPLEVAATRFALARALWDSGRDRKRAWSLAQQAREADTQAKNPAPPGRLQEVEAWLGARSKGFLRNNSGDETSSK